MDIGLIRGLLTVLSLLCFIGIVLWAYAPTQRRALDEASQLPLHDEH